MKWLEFGTSDSKWIEKLEDWCLLTPEQALFAAGLPKSGIEYMRGAKESTLESLAAIGRQCKEAFLQDKTREARKRLQFEFEMEKVRLKIINEFLAEANSWKYK